MPNESGELTAAEKHEQARAFALSGTLSKFQLAKQRKALQQKQQQQMAAAAQSSTTTTTSATSSSSANLEKVVPVKASRPAAKHPKPSERQQQHQLEEQLPPLGSVTSQELPLNDDKDLDLYLRGIREMPLVDVAAAANIESNRNNNNNIGGDDDDVVHHNNNVLPRESTTMVPAGASKWPRVERGDWQYVYICKGPFKGRFGYYDDQEGSKAVIYFGAPLMGDGPYEVPLGNLRKPPKNYCENVYTVF